ncbi:MAG TPA: aminotransferase class V-fold PLP-dependent enzyme, partial [Candidatus Binatia bacterium]
MSHEVYLDNNATTRVLPEVAEAMLPFLTEQYGNPSSIHRFGSAVGERLARAREQVASLLGAADPVEIVFTSCGTEGDNAAIRGMLETRPNKRHIVTTQVEHPAVLSLCQHLEKRGYRVTWLKVDENGGLDLEELRSALTDDTALVSVMWANNETGVIFPIEQIGAIVKAKGIPFHVDAVQAAGKLHLNVRDFPVDLMTISGHKFYAPKGVGALYVKRGLTFPPFMIGGHQERNRRGGTENVAGIIGMGAAAEIAASRIDADAARITKLRDRLEALLL